MQLYNGISRKLGQFNHYFSRFRFLLDLGGPRWCMQSRLEMWRSAGNYSSSVPIQIITLITLAVGALLFSSILLLVSGLGFGLWHDKIYLFFNLVFFLIASSQQSWWLLVDVVELKALQSNSSNCSSRSMGSSLKTRRTAIIPPRSCKSCRSWLWQCSDNSKG